MKIDIRGRVDNLKLATTHGLRPVFEAIANSIHAIEDRQGITGSITITIRRATSQGVLREGARKTHPITDFELRDNGVGFDARNYESFNTSDSRYKSDRGGKGIGRLLWLKAFTKAAVDSIYEKEGGRERRRFDFTYSQSGVENDRVEDAEDAQISTTVKLIGFKKEYQAKCPKSLDTLAQRIIEHCLEYLALDACPRMTLVDGTTGDEVDLNAMFAENLRTQREDFEVGGQPFQIMHVLTPPRPNEKHSINFCAHSRAVTSQPLIGVVPNLEASLTDPERDKPFVYAGYISSPVLDERVVAER
ncbi:MAG: ATP-binding protein, partial [Planctomycetota bacterium]